MGYVANAVLDSRYVMGSWVHLTVLLLEGLSCKEPPLHLP